MCFRGAINHRNLHVKNLQKIINSRLAEGMRSPLCNFHAVKNLQKKSIPSFFNTSFFTIYSPKIKHLLFIYPFFHLTEVEAAFL